MVEITELEHKACTLGFLNSRFDRQKTLFEYWLRGDESRNIGPAYSTIVAKTGFGKSMIGIMAAYVNGEKGRSSLIVVPTKPLKNDWEKNIELWGVKNTSVVIVNTLIMNTELYSTNLLVLDEVHMYPKGEQFSKVFKTKHNYLLGLTATVPEDDSAYFYWNAVCPAIAHVDWEESLSNKYISDFVIYVWPIVVSGVVEQRLTSWDNKFWKYNTIVGGFDNARVIMLNNKDPYDHVNRPKYESLVRRGIIIDEKQALAASFSLMRVVKKRAEFFYTSIHKERRAIELCNYFTRKKIITFSQRNDFVDKLSAKIEGSAAYHSGKSDKQAASILSDFVNNKSRILHTTNKLNVGVNIKDIDMSIFLSWFSTKNPFTQRLGRVVRLSEGKEKAVVVVNPIVRGDGRFTQDEKWLSKAMSEIPSDKIKKISTLEEIK